MKLHPDESLSAKLVAGLADAFPGSLRGRDAGLEAAEDDAVWGYAADEGFAVVSGEAFAVVSKDSGFH